MLEGCTPASSCTYDAGAVRVLNNAATSVTVNSVAVHIDTCTYTGWPSVTLAPGQSLIVTQLASGVGNGCTGPTPTYMDSSDIGPGGSSYAFNCTPDGITPTVDVTMNNTTITYTDSGQVLNTGGFDSAACPQPANESIPWTSIGSQKGAIQQVQHIIVLVQENRSADNYLGQLNAYGQPAYEAQPNNASNPNPQPGSTETIAAFHQTNVCESSDLNHSWNGAHVEWGGSFPGTGTMDGFTRANSNQAPPDGQDPIPVDPNDLNGRRAMGYYNENELPYYYKLYDTFATSDRYFSPVLSGTYPNRFYLLAGTSFGHIHNDFPSPPTGVYTLPNTDPPQPVDTIFDRLGNATPPISWKYYYGGPVPVLGTPGTIANSFQYVRQHPNNVAVIDQFYKDLANNSLPAVSFIDPTFTDLNNPPSTATDEHPPANVQIGQRYTYQVINAIEQNKNVWPNTVVFLTYDEAGGYYDHVPPPRAQAPDGISPLYNSNPNKPKDDVAYPLPFSTYGFRVPIAVVSPFAKAHYVSHVVHDHTSILAFIEARYGLKPLTARDAVADPMLEFFNFTQPPFLNPPPIPAPAITAVGCPQPLAQLSITNPGVFIGLPDGKVGNPYTSSGLASNVLAATGGIKPYSWSIANGALPPGLSLDAYTGAITGTPTMAGAFSFTASVTDATNQTATKATKITVKP